MESRLEYLAKRTGRTKTYYVREAIEEHLAELELAYLALARKQKPGKTHSADETKRALGL